MRVTRTNSKSYIALCSWPGCQYSTPVIRNRIDAKARLNHHSRTEHGADQREDKDMKQPTGDLPEQQDRLADYIDHLVVFTQPRKKTQNTSFGDREAIVCDVFAWVDGAWKELGDLPVFWKTVQAQIVEADGEDLGGVLRQGTMRNEREWNLAPVPKQNKAMTEALAAFDAGAF